MGSSTHRASSSTDTGGTRRTVAKIQDLFKGFAEAYGTYVIPPDGEALESGKRKGEARTIREPVTDELWAKHLEGSQGLGIIPINKANACSWGCVDIDVYRDFDPVTIWEKVKALGIPLTVCRSKSGGCHVYALFSEPVPAVKVRSWLTQVASALGHAQSEVFPKQTQLGEDNMGNWVNMPYMGGADDGPTTRYAYHPDTGEGMTLSEFEATVEASEPEAFFKFSLKQELKKKSASNEFSEAPPCLEALCAAGKFPEGSRNCGLMNMALFRRKVILDDEAWEKVVFADNNKYMGPGSNNEVRQILRSITKKKYEYQCNEEPLSSHCNRGLCQTRRYGVTHHQASVTGLQKMLTEPPVWILQVEDKPVRLSTKELTNQGLFQQAVLEQINMYPIPRKQQDWTLLIRVLIEKVQVIEMPEEATDEGRMIESIEDFVTSCTPATDVSQIHQGIPIEKEGRTFFRGKDLMNYLQDHGFRDIHKTRSAFYALISNMDSVTIHTSRKIAGHSLRLWSIVTPARVEIEAKAAEEVPF